MTVLRRLLFVGLGATLLGASVVAWLIWRALPDDTADQAVPGLTAPAEIRYDDARRPFVSAASLEDALLVQGWLHARERLWQMELLRRAGSGRLAEALGSSVLDSDRALWTAGVPQLARTLAGNASPFLRALVARYVDGINAAITARRGAPVEFLLTGTPVQPWSAADVYAVAALVAYQSAGNRASEQLRLALAEVLDGERFGWLLPAEAAGRPDAAAGVEGAGRALAALDALSPLDAPRLPGGALGSNGWVVGPQRSASGRPLFAFDSHDDLGLPNLFYEVHLFFPPGRQIRGWSVAGMPGVINGYNESLAWGFTNIGDTQDLFVETLHPDDPGLALGPEGWYPLRETVVDITVAGREQPERLAIRYTRHGPLVHDDPPLALRWTGHHVGELGMDAFLHMNLATDWATFSAAADRLPVPSANITYADRHGTIAARTVGLLPDRGRGDGLLPRPGHDPAWDWRGLVAAADLPRLVNPPSGFLVAANTPLPIAAGPLVSADHAPGYRAERLHAALSGPGTLTLDDQQRLQLDWYNGQARRLLPHLLAAVRIEALGDPARRALAVLSDWSANPVNGPEQAGALIYEHWYLALARTLIGPALPAALYQRLLANNYVLNQGLDRILLDAGSSVWWGGERDARLTSAFVDAVAAIVERFGDDPTAWRWDAAQRVQVHHELGGAAPLLGRWLNRGPYAWGGGPATVGRARYRYHQPFDVRAAATVRVVAELGNPFVVRAIMPGGQSGHAGSRHYADQLPRWLAGSLDPLPDQPPLEPMRVARLRPGPVPIRP